MKEGFDFSSVEAGDILSALQQINLDINNIKKKDLKDLLENLIANMRNLLNPKSDKKLVHIIQKIICAIKEDMESNNDFKDTIESSIFELENYFKSKKVILNKPIKTTDDNNSLAKPIKKPVESEVVKKNQELSPEDNKKVAQEAPPLAGTGEKLNNIV